MSARRDYKPAIQTPRKARKHQRVRVLGWMVVILALGGAAAGGVAWWRNHQAAKAAASALPAAGPAPLPAAGYLATGVRPAEDARSVKKNAALVIEAPKSKFDFYSVLKDRQVTIPQDEIGGRGPRTVADPTVIVTTIQSGAAQGTATPSRPGQAASAVAPAPVPQPAAARGYLIQAGAFPSAAQADKVRATLAMLGVPARVEAGTLPDSTPVHRVRLGPYKDATQAAAVRQKLTEAGVPSIAIKVD